MQVYPLIYPPPSKSYLSHYYYIILFTPVASKESWTKPSFVNAAGREDPWFALENMKGWFTWKKHPGLER